MTGWGGTAGPGLSEHSEALRSEDFQPEGPRLSSTTSEAEQSNKEKKETRSAGSGQGHDPLQGWLGQG